MTYCWCEAEQYLFHLSYQLGNCKLQSSNIVQKCEMENGQYGLATVKSCFNVQCYSNDSQQLAISCVAQLSCVASLKVGIKRNQLNQWSDTALAYLVGILSLRLYITYAAVAKILVVPIEYFVKLTAWWELTGDDLNEGLAYILSEHFCILRFCVAWFCGRIHRIERSLV